MFVQVHKHPAQILRLYGGDGHEVKKMVSVDSFG